MSKGLKALEIIWNLIDAHTATFQFPNYVDIKKELKALEVIKNKRVDMWHLMNMLEQDYAMYLTWCFAEKYRDEFILTQEEFILLKEVLKNE